MRAGLLSSVPVCYARRMAKTPIMRSITEVSRLGGLARAAKLSKEQRSAAARKASRARWKKAAKVALVLLCVARPVRAESPRAVFADLAPYAAAIVGNAADLVTTRQAFAHGATEINPLISGIGSSSAGISAVKIGFTSLLLIEMRYLSTHGHPTAAKWIGYVDGAIMLGVAAHNRTVAR